MDKKKELCICGKTKTPPFCDHSHSHKEMPAAPVKKELCTCGKTKTPPFCDHSHSHKKMPAAPVKKRLCTCGKTKTPPFCDHSHELEGHEGLETATALPGETLVCQRKILLILLPYWNPLIPPQGIAHLKHFLQNHGYIVKTVDANLEAKFKQLMNQYFSTLKKWIPEYNRGNFYNIGNDVLREHMMAHINYENEEEYIELVKILIFKVFYCPVSESQVVELNAVLSEFYFVLEHYFANLLDVEQPAVVGVSVFRDTLAPSLFAFRVCRKKYPHIKTVMGGGVFSIQLIPGSPNLEYFLEKTKDCIDKIIIGRGETLFLKFLQGQLPGPQRLHIMKSTDEDFASLAREDIPDLSDFDPGLYQYQAAFGSMGCPFRCSFCNVGIFYGNYREKNAGQTVAEMAKLRENHGSRLFFMLDELVNPIINEISKEVIKANLPIYWDGYFRIDEAACKIENTMSWRQGGFYRARIGIESGSQRILDLMNKKITLEQIKNAVINLAIAGIKTTLYVVIGHPGETEEDFRQTLDLMEELRVYTWEAECNPFTYIYSGQSKADEWAEQRVQLYPQWAKDMLIAQTWIVEGVPTREQMYDRVYRFVQHCTRLEISTPWTLYDINKADKRWQELHKNAVPALLDLVKPEYKEENRSGKKLQSASVIPQDKKDKEEFAF